MKIGNPIDKPVIPPTTAGRGNPAEAANAGAVKAADGSTVALSNAATSLLQGSGSVQGAGADFDAEKVDRITREIDEGRYRVDPEAIADKLLANARELLGRPN